MKYFVILILFGFAGLFFSPVLGIPEFTGDEIAAGAFVILKGEVLSFTEQGRYRYYELKVHEYIKNEQSLEIVTMRSLKPEFIDPIAPYETFEKGDFVFAYLYPLDETRYYSGHFSHEIESLDSYGKYHHTPDSIPQVDESYPTPDIKIPETKTKPSVPSPLHQLQNGVDKNDILCNTGFSLIFKKHRDKPACVKNGDVFDLINRGWAKNVIEKSGSAWDTAEQFLQFSPTYQFDGKEQGTGISHLTTDESFNPHKVLLLATFTKYYEGYGDRSNKNPSPLPDYDNRAEMLLQIQGKQVLSAIVNNEWDELNQQYIVDEPNLYHDFVIVYQKHGGITGANIRYEIASKSGYIRQYDHPEDIFIPISRTEAESFWEVIETENILDRKSQHYEPNPSCADCMSYGLSVTTEENRVEFSWSDGIVFDEILQEIGNQIESLVKEFENRKTFLEVYDSGVDFSFDPQSTMPEPEPIPEPEPSDNVYLVDQEDIIVANNQFALDFYSEVAEDDQNIFFSPWSISTAFSIVYEGARGDTAKEIRNAFGFIEEDEKRRTSFSAIHEDLNKENANYKMLVANALWIAEDFELFEEYVDTAKTYYDSEVDKVNFETNGADIINAWVKEKTEGNIEELFDPSSLGGVRLAITNAVYFNGSWVYPFDEQRTSEQEFMVNAQKTVKVPMMSRDYFFNYTETEQFQILELPYEGNKLSMLILLPNDVNGIKGLEESLSSQSISRWNDQLSKTRLLVQIPKFTMKTSYDLIPELKDLGIKTAFGPADFSGISDADLFISQAVHKGFVDVNEVGTEAAAATGIAMRESAPPSFRADHPFIFLIQDTHTSNILFIGKVADPI